MKSKKTPSRTSTKVKKLPKSSSSFSKKWMLVCAGIFGAIGVATLLFSFAATKTVVYFGALTATKPTATYKMTTAAGNMHVDFTNNTADALLSVTNKATGKTVGTLKSKGKTVVSLDANVNAGTYVFKVYTYAKFTGKKGYKVVVSYPDPGSSPATPPPPTPSPQPTPTDTTPPTAIISTPLNKETVAGSVAFNAVAADTSGISKVDFYVNSSLVGSDSSTPYGISWNTKSVANGTATLSIKVYDGIGNLGEASGVVDVNNTVVTLPPPPTTGFDSTLLQPPAGKLLLGAEINAGGYTTAKSLRGKELQVYHTYATSGAQIKNLIANTPTGTIPLINFKPGGAMGPAEYKKILAGDRDASIKDAAAAAKAYGKKFFLAPMHEPENDDKNAPYVGDADYAKAFKYTIDMMKANGATNIVVVWNMMGAGKWMSRYNTLYPGDGVVDWIASDPYSVGANDTLTSFHSVKDFYAWGAAHNKPMMWSEWGLDSAAKANANNFFSKAGLDALQKQMPLLKGLIYWSEWQYVLTGYQSQWTSFSNLDAFNWTVPASAAK